MEQKALSQYLVEELCELHPDDVGNNVYGFSLGDWEKRKSFLCAQGTPCEGCVHIQLRYPLAGMYPCNSCSRACTDKYESTS